jgi:hypothetical protein
MNMTKFDNKRFTYDGMYLHYDGKFVARFKYGGMVSFKNFLRENFTVEEYFDLLENQGMPPLKVLETKGYVAPQIARILYARGYRITLEGLNQMINNDIARRIA